jgi:RNA polymerase sigma-70 factor (ECF subfamily)
VASTPYNAYTADVEQDLNLPRPIVAGGTGGTSPATALANLSAEQAEALDAVMTSASDAPHPAHALGARELLDKLLATLSPPDAWLIRLLELEGLSIEQVRQRTGWSSTRIRVRAFRARRKLNRSFEHLKKRGEL